MRGFDREVRFEILEQIGVISTHSTGWQKELNLVSWNGGTPKIDIRDWDQAHEHMSRGVTLTEGEMQQVMNLMLAREKTKVSLQERITEAKELQEQQETPQKGNEQAVER